MEVTLCICWIFEFIPYICNFNIAYFMQHEALPHWSLSTHSLPITFPGQWIGIRQSQPQRCQFVAPTTKIPWFDTPRPIFFSLGLVERLGLFFYITVTRNIEWIEDNNNQECHKASLKATLWVHESFRRKLQFAVNLNNKGRLDGDIWGDGLCGFVWVFTLYLRNGATYEYEICTANSCDDTLKSEVLIFYVF